jgi:hypothetical protein
MSREISEKSRVKKWGSEEEERGKNPVRDEIRKLTAGKKLKERG